MNSKAKDLRVNSCGKNSKETGKMFCCIVNESEELLSHQNTLMMCSFWPWHELNLSAD